MYIQSLLHEDKLTIFLPPLLLITWDHLSRQLYFVMLYLNMTLKFDDYLKYILN